jgi:hypothetical protein
VAGRFLVAGAVGALIAWVISEPVWDGLYAGAAAGWIAQAIGLRWWRKRHPDSASRVAP